MAVSRFRTRDTAAAIHDVAGNVVAIIWSSRIIDELKRLERIVWEEKERTEVGFDLVADAIFMTDAEGAVTFMNKAATDITGWTIAEAHGKSIETVAPLEHEESREPVSSPARMVLLNSQPVQPGYHYVVVRKDGTAFPVEDSAAPILGRDGLIAGTVLALRPVGRKAPATAPGRYVRVQDPATGVLARREIEHRLEQALLSASRDSTSHTLISLKVQRYDEFVKHYGQVAGTELLRQVAIMLGTQIREVDEIARLGRSEFAVLLQRCPLDQGQRIASQARRVFRNFPFYWEGNTHQIVVQFGVIPITSDSGSVSRDAPDRRRGVSDGRHGWH